MANALDRIPAYDDPCPYGCGECWGSHNQYTIVARCLDRLVEQLRDFSRREDELLARIRDLSEMLAVVEAESSQGGAT